MTFDDLLELLDGYGIIFTNPDDVDERLKDLGFTPGIDGEVKIEPVNSWRKYPEAPAPEVTNGDQA